MPPPFSPFSRAPRVLAVLLGLALAVASYGTDERDFDLPATDLATALKEFSRQSDAQVLVPSDLATGVRTRAVKGRLALDDALAALLDGTGLRAVPEAGDGTFALVRRPKPASVAPRNAAAVIVIGLTTDRDQAARLWSAAETVRDGLLARGVPERAITILPRQRRELARRDAIVGALHALPSGLAETWVVLLGSAANDRDGVPAFQISGRRFSAADLASAARELPGRKYIVVGTSRSGGFLPLLAALPQVDALAATAPVGELNEPRFAQIWADELVSHPDADFLALARAATARTSAYYAGHQLAESEHACVIDPATRRVIEVTPAPTPAAAPSS